MTNAAKSRVTGSDTKAQAASPIATSSLGSGEDRRVLALPRRLTAAWKSRLAGSVWLPVVARSAGVALAMAVLAGVGAASSLAGSGVPLESQASASGVEALAGVWLAPAPSASAAPPRAAPSGALPPAPTPGPTAAPPAESAPAATPEKSEKPGVTPDGKVILNTADATELTRLPRVGPKKAAAIIELRTRLGRFKKPSDLLRVKGIGPKTLQLMLPQLVLDPPET